MALSLQGVWIQILSILALMCNECGSEPTSVLIALQPPLKISVSMSGRSPEYPPCFRTSLQSFFFPSPLGRVQTTACGPAPPVRFCLAHRPLQEPTWGPSVPELHGDLWGVGRKEPVSPVLCSSVTWALNWPCVCPESYKVFMIPAPSALNSERQCSHLSENYFSMRKFLPPLSD